MISGNKFPVKELYIKNEKLRVKTTDRCNMNCWFCHSEGAPHSPDIVINDTLRTALDYFGVVFNKAHLTGGEPFLYPCLNELLMLLEEKGYETSITTNGNFEHTYDILNVIHRLQYINFSFHSLEPSYYSMLSSSKNGAVLVDRIASNITKFKTILPVHINTVVSGDGVAQHLDEMIHFAEEQGCALKLVPELKSKELSSKAIDALLTRNGYHLYERRFIIPSSNMRELYKNSEGFTIEVKKLTACFPRFCCDNCESYGNCEEGFSFLRIGGNPLYCQTCIRKKPASFEDFRITQWDSLKKAFLNENIFV